MSVGDMGESILQEAERLTNGDRQNDYGHPLHDFNRTAGLWTALFGHKLTEPLTAEDVALAIVCVKMSRQINAPKRDNLVDGAGYLNCLDMVIKERERLNGQAKD